jgi:hypothetical protein
VFSCSPKDGDKWIEKILLARVNNLYRLTTDFGADFLLRYQSYILHQERTVLFARGSGPTGASSPPGTSKALPRSLPRKQPNIQPLVNVSAPFTMTSPTSATFEPGSLLAKRSEF